ncbi:hypothetical protein M0804_000915 [Polistes exclamans]|nr:hypothetical protein M0804_000915 [Polistes exclamans]
MFSTIWESGRPRLYISMTDLLVTYYWTLRTHPLLCQTDDDDDDDDDNEDNDDDDDDDEYEDNEDNEDDAAAWREACSCA